MPDLYQRKARRQKIEKGEKKKKKRKARRQRMKKGEKKSNP